MGQGALRQHEPYGLPENRADDGFDERAFEEAIRETRRRELAELAELNA